MIAAGCLALLTLSIGLLIGSYAVNRDLRQAVTDMRNENGILRDELKVVNDSIARAAKVPIIRREPARELEKLDTWFDGRPRLEKITVGDSGQVKR